VKSSPTKASRGKSTFDISAESWPLSEHTSIYCVPGLVTASAFQLSVEQCQPNLVMALQKYVYTPLDRSARQIRLLQFVQLDEEGINCTLETYDIASCPPFVAMSYTWGVDASPRSEILLNGAAFRVRPNLGEMLASMRERLRLGGDKFLDSIRVMNPDRPWAMNEVGGNNKR
jgi:hypothetical protein